MEITPPSPCLSCGQSLDPATVNKAILEWSPFVAYRPRPIGRFPRPLGQPEYIPLTDLCLSCSFELERQAAIKLLDRIGASQTGHAVWMMQSVLGYDLNEEWADFSVLVFGKQLGNLVRITPGRFSSTFNTSRVPWRAYYRRPIDDCVVVIQAWLRRVRYRDTPLYLEERWNPTLAAPRVTLHGIEDDVPSSDACDALRRGRKLLHHLSQRGRPPGGRFDSPEECRDAVATAIEERVRAVQGWNKADRKFSQDDIACMLFGIDNGARQLRRALRPYKWQEIVDEVLKANL